MNMFELHRVTKSFSTTRDRQLILDQVDLTIPTASLTSFFGPNGAGKTTLMELIAGLQQPDSGEISRATSLQAGDIAIVPQEYKNSLQPWETVRGAVGFPLRLKGFRRSDIDKRFDRLAAELGFGIDPTAKIFHLSGGEAQLTSLMRALIIQPKVLILDEFLAAMDYGSRIHLRQLVIETCCRLKLTLLNVSHDLDDSLMMATRMVFLSSRPTRVTELLEVNLPFPRTASSEISQDFVTLKEHAIDIVTADLQRQNNPSRPSDLPPESEDDHGKRISYSH
jgi:NitT/TauT family transport system ATP-binding protein